MFRIRKNLTILLTLISFYVIAQEADFGDAGATETGILNNSLVRIRKEPNLGGEFLGYLDKGQEVHIIGKTDETMKIGDMESVWYKIKTSEGIEGWAYGSFIDLIESTKIIYNPNEDILTQFDQGVRRSEKEFEFDKFKIVAENPISNRDIIVKDFHGYTLKELETLFDLSIDYSNLKDNFDHVTNIALINSEIKIVLEYLYYSEKFRIYYIEYIKNSNKYDYKIKIGDSREKIQSILGNPSFYSDSAIIYFPYIGDIGIFDYIVIYFDDSNQVNKVQILYSNEE